MARRLFSVAFGITSLLFNPAQHSPAAIIFNPQPVPVNVVPPSEPSEPEPYHTPKQTPPSFYLKTVGGRLVAMDHNGKEYIRAKWDGEPPAIDKDGCMRYERDGSYDQDRQEHTTIQYDDGGFLRIVTNRSDDIGRCEIRVIQTAANATMSFHYTLYEGEQIMVAHQEFFKTVTAANFEDLLKDHKIRKWFDNDILSCFDQDDLKYQQFENAQWIESLFARVHLSLLSKTFVDTCREMVKHLDDDDWKPREDATQKLITMGIPAGLYLSSLDRDKLSPEQQSRVDDVLCNLRE